MSNSGIAKVTASKKLSRPELSAKSKTVVVTGGGTGIGAETAKRFAEAGASRIALLGRREQPLIDTQTAIEKQFPGTEVFIAPTDVSNKSQVDSAIAKFVGDGKIDVMISNAAVGPLDPIKDVDTEKFIQGVQMNVEGALYVAQAFLRYAARDAVAIEINSAAAHINVPGGAFAAYSVAKMAVYRLWDSLASGHPNLRVFHVQPGVVDTAMNREAGGTAALGMADDVSLPGCFNVWLASPEACFLKGKFLWANWDVDELKSGAGKIEAGNQLNFDLVGWPFGEAGWNVNET